MHKKIIDTIFILILLIVAFGVMSFSYLEYSKYIYECTDYKGNIVYCTYIEHSKSGVWGRTMDGRKIMITSHKLVLK